MHEYLTPYVGTHIVQITDTFDDDAKAKIESAYVLHTSRNGIYAHASILPAANSIVIGTKASELVNNSERPDRLILAVNFAPPDKKEGTKNNARNDFFCADLGDNVFVCGTSNGLEFSYLKPRIQSLYRLTTTNNLGSQFRSLQILPKHAVLFSLPHTREQLITSGDLVRIEHIDDIVPSVPDITHVLQVDNFQNVKLVLSQNDRHLLERLAVARKPIEFAFGKSALTFGIDARQVSNSYEGIASEKLFDVPVGTNIVAAQSSSLLTGDKDVPMIATMRENPAETRPTFDLDLPGVGFPVFLADPKRHPPAHAARTPRHLRH